MKRIVVTHRLAHDPATDETRDCLDVRWTEFLAEAGLVALPIPSGVSPPSWLAAAGPVNGVLLTGGNDVVSVSPSPLNDRRQAFEEALLDAAPGVPTLGICRGCQFLAARDGFELRPVSGHVRTRHALAPEGDAEPFQAFGGQDANSFHGTGIVGSGRQLRVALRSPDGAVEAIAHPSRRLAGLMWHPERESPFRSCDLEFFKEFFR